MGRFARFTARSIFLAVLVVPLPSAGQPKSVKPGINKALENPDVAKFVARFEREGREIYDQRDKIVAACGLQPGMAVADIGAGTGLFTRLFAPQVGPSGRVYAVDIAEQFIRHILQTSREQGFRNVVGVVCKRDSVELPAHSIDLAFLCDVYHHFEFPQKTMRSIHQALRPDGQLVVIDFRRVEGVSSKWVLGHVRAGQQTFTREITEAGFKLAEEKKLLKRNYFLRFEKVAAPQSDQDEGRRAAAPEDENAVAPLPATIPAPMDNPTTPATVALGLQLFFDPRLSGNNTVSCATCHIPYKALADGLPTAKGVGGKTLKRNTPTLLNVGLQSCFFWDGRAATLEQQALLPIQSPDEMNQDLGQLEQELNAVPGYVSQFQAVFGTPVRREGIAKALAAFERTLVTKDSPFDRYLSGDKQALSPDAQRGMELFLGEAGCVRCHRGPLLSDGKFYRLGVSFQDEGLAAVTGKSEDRYKFRTPTLRNVAQTAPYMHDGSLPTLDDVVLFYYREVSSMSPDGLPLDVEPLQDQSFSDMPQIVEFLKALSGQTPHISAPELP